MISRSRALRWTLTAGILVLLVIFGRSIEWRHTWAAIRNASLSLLLIAVLLNLVSIHAKGVRWWVFLAPVSPAPLGLVMRATIAGAGLNDIVVANGGDIARGVLIARVGDTNGATIVATLAVERLFDVICYVLLLAFAGLFLTLPERLEIWTYPAGFALAALIAFLIFLLRAPAQAPMVESVAGAKRSLLARVQRQLWFFAGAVRQVSSAPRFAAALALSLLSWMTQWYCYHFAARAAGLPITATGSLACLLAVNLGLIVRATPGNVGFFQFVYALTAGAFGIAKAPAVAGAFLIQASQMIPVVTLGIVLMPELIFRKGNVRVAPEGPPT